MKFPWTIPVIAGLCLVLTGLKAETTPNIRMTNDLFSESGLSDREIKERLRQLDFPFEVRYTEDVENYIRRYLTAGYKDAEAMLGRASLYFPIFEHYLNLHNLPEALKYLPMVESALLPRVTSEASAAGLWQFVPSTARYFGLEINANVDERLDPYRSTEAAVKMLNMLYEEFGDWPLVLAAYNAGPGRVRQALKVANCKNYWDALPYLPRESQKYVPAFIAAAYLVNYYHQHELQPRYPSFDLQETRTFRVYNYVTFGEIARATGAAISSLRMLNPSFRADFIPRNSEGNFLRVPGWAANGVRQYLDQKSGISASVASADYFRSSYIVIAGDHIESIAMLLRCRVEDLMKWNGLKNPEVVVNQFLTVYLPKRAAKVRP